jgi:hypothetical protein
MEALTLLIYAFCAPIGIGCLLFIMWRLEDRLLGPVLQQPSGPERQRLNQAAMTDPVRELPLVYVGAIRDQSGLRHAAYRQRHSGSQDFQEIEHSDRPKPVPESVSAAPLVTARL